MIEMTDELVQKYKGLLKERVSAIMKPQDKENTWRIEYQDLLQEAYLAMANACSKFDPDRGIQFSTYLQKVVDNHLMGVYRQNSRSFTVSQEQNRIVTRIDRGIKKGLTLEEIADGLVKEDAEKAAKEGKTFSEDLLDKKRKLYMNKVYDLINLNTNTYSLDFKVVNEKDGNKSNFVDAYNTEKEDVGEREFKNKLEIMVDSLKNNTKVTEEDKIRYYRMKGLFDYKSTTLKDLANEAGISVHKFRAHMQSVAAVLEHDIKKDIWYYNHVGEY